MSAVFLSTVSSEAQILIVFFIVIISIVIHKDYRPYYKESMNKMEIFSLYVAALTMYSGIFYVTG